MVAVFDPKRCAHVGGNLWRGNLPLNSNRDFAFDELVAVLGIESHDPFVDVSVIDNVAGSERDVWLKEMEAFAIDVDAEWPQNRPDIPPQFNQTAPPWKPNKMRGVLNNASLVWWQIEGGDNPTVLGPSSASYNFIGFIEYVAWMNTLGAPIYVHCMNGTDRTGATVAAFAMRALGYSLKDAFELADSVPAAGTMNRDYVKLVKAYAREKGFK